VRCPARFDRRRYRHRELAIQVSQSATSSAKLPQQPAFDSLVFLAFLAVRAQGSNGQNLASSSAEPGTRMDVDCASIINPVVHGGRVLLVDDERMLRRVIRRGLVRAGFEVVEADNGVAALELLARERFDLVVSDVHMPLMDGVELLEAVSTAQPAVPVVLISGSLEVQGKEEARRLGAFDFLKKPFALTELHQIALRAVSRLAEVMPPNPKDLQHASVS
jgi:CheY-like chemotaxis protein